MREYQSLCLRTSPTPCKNWAVKANTAIVKDEHYCEKYSMLAISFMESAQAKVKKADSL